MRRSRAVLSTALALATAGGAPRSAPSSSPPLAITHVTIVGLTGAPSREGMTVVVDNGRITLVAPGDSPILPADARVLDGTGRFLIPGLWDMHVHAAWQFVAEPAGALFVANGVLGVRDMWGDPSVIRNWQSRVARADLRVPRLVAAGNLIDGPVPVWPNATRVSNAAQAREAVQRLKRDGAAFIKVYSRLPREAYFAIADESKRLGIPFVGHVPIVVTAAEAADSGQKSIEHLTGVTIGCAAHEDEWMRAVNRALETRGWVVANAVVRSQPALLAADFDPARCATLAQRFVADGTWQVPTLTVLHNTAWLGDTSLENDPRLRWMPDVLRQRWNARNETPVPGETAAGRQALYRRELEIVGLLSRAGVPILAGTDELNPYCMPGFSLHDELARLVEAGLTPLEALQSATVNPANFLGASDSMGTVAPGKLADLVLLDADPLADIHNTTRIAAVVFHGQLLDSTQLLRMMADASHAGAPPAAFGPLGRRRGAP